MLNRKAYNETDDNALPESCEDHAARLRLRAVLLYENGYSLAQILAEAECSRSTLLNWYRIYKQQGPEALCDHRQGGNNAKLTDQQTEDLCERLGGRTPRDLLGSRAATPDGQFWTVEDLYNVIWQWYGVKYKSRTSYYNLLKKCVPAKWRSE